MRPGSSRLKANLRAILAGYAFLSGSSLVAQGQVISTTALQQIRDLLQEKEARTPTEQKIGSQLIYAIKMARGQQIARSVPSFSGAATVLSTDAPAGVLVDIRGSVSSSLLASVSQSGGRILYASVPRGVVRARVPLSAVAVLASRPDVKSVTPGSHPRLNGITSFEGRQSRFASGAWRSEWLPFGLARFLGLSFFVGSVATQGVVTHAASAAASTYHVNGSGVRVGVLSDSAEKLPNLIASGDLPADTTIVQEISGGPGTSEGTALMEIIYDMAPGAKLYFASGSNGEESMADNIRTLRNTYGCDIIVDDLSYAREGVFQDSTIAQAVNDVTASGAIYFSAVGGNGNLTSGNSGTWEGDFKSGGTNALLPGYTLHDFGGGQLYDKLTGNTAELVLQWSDPLGGSANDYDLFVLNSAGTAVIFSSTDVQSGTQDPVEHIVEQYRNRDQHPDRHRRQGQRERACAAPQYEPRIATVLNERQHLWSQRRTGHHQCGCGGLEQRAGCVARLSGWRSKPDGELRFGWAAADVLQRKRHADHSWKPALRDEWRAVV